MPKIRCCSMSWRSMHSDSSREHSSRSATPAVRPMPRCRSMRSVELTLARSSGRNRRRATGGWQQSARVISSASTGATAATQCLLSRATLASSMPSMPVRVATRGAPSAPASASSAGPRASRTTAAAPSKGSPAPASAAAAREATPASQWEARYSAERADRWSACASKWAASTGRRFMAAARRSMLPRAPDVSTFEMNATAKEPPLSRPGPRGKTTASAGARSAAAKLPSPMGASSLSHTGPPPGSRTSRWPS
mmetsp:Transcript_267/g.812  ORF Transcript_267/g.812 Transcript_267/m.812 type:complete len:253 (+) Transcript_267:9104-9862(+)